MALGTFEILIIAAFIGFPLLFVVGGVFLFRFVNKMNAANMKICPLCAERVQLAAKVCRYCRRDI